MATTDARAGFRLPWSSDRQSTDPADGEPGAESRAAATTGWPSEDTAPSAPAVDAAAADAPAADAHAPGTPAGEPPAPSPLAPSPGRKPSKFLADLTKAMQAAAEEARGRALTQLQADAKAHVESIHDRSSTEAANLRRKADDDVAAVREWSKAEIARIREETETRITDRKGRLESEIEEHAAVIEREIDAVQKTVAAFEDEMAAFFERLLGEEDPSRFATMAENLPEPPTFEGFAPAAGLADEPEPEAEAVALETVTEAPEAVAAVELPEAAETEASVETAETETWTEPGTAETVEAEATEPEAAAESAVGDEALATDVETVDHPTGFAVGGEDGDGEVDREAAFAAIQAAAEAAASAEVAADAAARAEAVADVAIEIIGNHDESETESDPRFAALGLSPDFDAAEAEALVAADSSDGEDIPVIGDDALAARLAGLVPGKGKNGSSGETTATQVVVVGLVSVASIASFKRHLGRLPGVQSVGVSSGPDGEFIFAVNHAADVSLKDAVPSLPSFQARVTGSADGTVHVTAHDPEADA